LSQPDLFVVCKNCGSEVSPYVTECPYCGQRVRKRAPKLNRGAEPKPPKVKRSRSLPRMRRGEIPGIALDSKPWGTISLVVISLLATVALATGEVSVIDLGAVYGPIEGDWWRLLAAPFVYNNGGYEFVALVSIGVFGTALERRYGSFVPVAIFLAAGAAGVALAVGTDMLPALGGNGAALGLVTAWFVDYRFGRNDGDADLLGVYVFAAVLFLMSVAYEPASIAAAVGGTLVGAVAGYGLAHRT
jgi:membrane associated rhomboid family serine protease